MEMDYVTEFPHSHMDRRPRKRAKLAWELPQTHSKGHSGMYYGQEIANMTSFGTSRIFPEHAGLVVKGLAEKGSPPWRDDDKDGHYIFALGDNLTSRYKILRKIGEGTFGQVLECWDRELREQVAIKVVRSIKKYREAAMVEVDVLQLLGKYDKNGSRCVQIRNWFDYRNHICIVFEMLGPSLYDFLRKNNYRPFPVDLVRELGRQLLECVAFMHDLRLIHTDLKPENVLFVSPEYVKIPDYKATSRSPKEGTFYKRLPKSSAIKVIDFGSTAYEHQDHNYIVSTRHYRAPEVILGLGWSFPCDIWSVGCILVELCSGEALFQTHENLEHLAMMERVLGPMPMHMFKKADRHAEKYVRRGRSSSSSFLLYWSSGMAEELDKPLLGPENFNREGIDLERLPLGEVFEQLRTSERGLSSDDAEARLQIFGPNKLEEKTENKILKFLSFMWNPLSWVMEAAAVMAIVLANGGGEGPDWQDFVGIICLLVINSTISFIEENNAGNAAAALMARLAPKTKVLRDGQWQEQDAAILVPGDIISIKLGDIIPADARLLEGDPLKIDQSALTGESLPVTKKTGDEVFSGSTCKHGEIEAVVIATGVHSFFGKAAHLVDSTIVVGHFQQVLTSIGNFCICSIAVGMILEIIVMYPVQHRSYRKGINNLLVLLIGGIPIAMPTVLSVTLAIGSHRLSQQGAITKRMTAIEEMAGMDVLCSDKTGTLTLNRLTVDRNLVEVFNSDMDKDMVVLLAARAARMENQDAIDAAIISMLADPKEARTNITEVHFLPFNPVDKRTAITYIDSDGNWCRASKGAPEQILNMCQEKDEIARKVHAIIDKFAERGLRSLAVAYQEVPEKSKDSPGGPWTFCGLLPLFDPPRHDSAETIRRALSLGVCVKMITGDQLAIAKETGRRLGMGTNMYPSSSLFGRERDENEPLPIDELIEKADGFAGVFPEHKYEIVKILQEKKHVVGMTGDGVNDAPALKKADIGIAVSDSTDAARGAADLVLTEPGLSVIVSAVLTSRAIFQRMKNYTIYAVSITIRIVLGFVLLALIWEYDFPPFMVLIIAILNDGTIMTISKDRVKPSPTPDSWKLPEIFATGIVIGTYLALVTVLFYWAVVKTTFFETHFHVISLSSNHEKVSSAVYLQVSIISQALIFVTRSRGWSFLERPGALLMCAFVVAQLVATLIAVYAHISFAYIKGIGWKWAGIIWLYSLVFYVPLDIIKFAVRYVLSGEAWNLLFDRKTAFTSKKDYGKDDREAKWILSQRSLQGLMTTDLEGNGRRSSLIAEQARRRAEIARLGELHTLKGHVESVVRLKNLDLKLIQSAHTV